MHENNATNQLLNHEELTFSQLLSLWQESNEIRLKGATKNKYSNLIITHINPALGHFKLSELTSTAINNYLFQQLQEGRKDGKGGLSASYIRSIAVVINSAINYGVRENICLPLKSKIHKPSITKNELHVLTVAEQKKLEKAIFDNISATSVGIMISLYTGLRLGEVCALSWEDIDFTLNIIHVRHTVARIKSSKPEVKTELILDEPKTYASRRCIPIPAPLIIVLKKYKSSSQSAYVVSERDSFISPRTFSSRYQKFMKKCHLLDINYHALRHTFATRCIEAGVDIKSLSEILGHASTSITLNTYVHSSLEMKKRQLEKLTSFLK